MHEVWSRVREGRHAVVVGAPPPPPETLDGEPRWLTIHVDCGDPRATWGPLEDAHRRIAALLGEQGPRYDEVRDRVGTSTRFLGELAEPTVEATLVGASNRLAERLPQRVALVVESLHEADGATIQELREILGRKGWLRLPVVLGVAELPEEGPLAELLATIEGEPITAEAAEQAPEFEWSSLGPELLLTMRAAAVAGRSFDVDLVAGLLGVSPDVVLVHLQQVSDQGVPLSDHGRGRFLIPEGAQRALTQRILPSLVERWHRRLGELLGASTPIPVPEPVRESEAEDEVTGSAGDEVSPSTEDESASEAAEDEATPPVSASYDEVLEPAGEDRLASESRGTTPPGEVSVAGVKPEATAEAEPEAKSEAKPEATAEAEPEAKSESTSDTNAESTSDANAEAAPSEVTPPTPAESRPAKPEASTSAPAEAAEAAAAAKSTSSQSEPPAEPPRNKTVRISPEQARRLFAEEAAKRSPAEAAAMGLPERAVEQYLAALRKVASRGDSRRALLIAEQALSLLSRQWPSRGRDLLRVRVLAMAARVQWRGAGRGPALTLQGALETLDEAVELMPPDPPLDLNTEIAQLVAGVCYDLGDISSLQRALDALTDAARALMAAGESVRAARLLNDQAAVYLRAGDPVRANHLLQQSRTIFDKLHRERPDDPTVIVERAETEHLLARLPLHARLREGREDDAFSLALGHARAAAEGYRHLGGRVELGRVLETMGRLEIARGRHPQAAEHLGAALRISRQLGDVTGLARSTAALANLYIATEQPAEALNALEESVAFNVDKGSPLGLAVNRRTMERLRKAIAASQVTPPRLVQTVQKVDRALAKAEAMLGRVSVPGDLD